MDASKSQKEKMLAGELYNASTKELVDERRKTGQLLKIYNKTEDDQWKDRFMVLKELFGAVGLCSIETPFKCDYGKNIYIGNKVYMNSNVLILDSARVDIGDEVMFGPNVQLYTSTHPTDAEIRAQQLQYALPIKIGNRVWLGASAIILPGVCIGDNTTIGAGSVVTRSIPANCVAAGNPCKIIKKLGEKNN